MIKIRKQELVNNRPVWMTRLLLNLPADIYESCKGQEQAKGQLARIADCIKKSELLEKKKNLRLQMADGLLQITNVEGRPYIQFYVETARQEGV